MKELTDLTCTRLKVDVEMIRRLKKDLMSRDDLEELAELLSLAGNDTRLKILYLLCREKELCVCDLADIMETTVSAVSHQLRKLKDRNLIKCRRDGQTIYYSLQDSTIMNFLRRLFDKEV